jgi:hypothetical protein
MTPNLIPERRIDKNGKGVTRHVRAQEHATERRDFPPPSSSQPATGALILKFVETLPEYGMDGVKAGAILRELDNFSNELFSGVIASYLGCSKDERAVWRVALNSGRPDGDLYETHYRRMIELVQLSVALLPDAPPGYRSHKIAERAEAAESITGVYPGDPEYVETKAWMIVQEIESLRPDAFGSTAGARAFIAENLEKVMPLIPELLKRRTASEGVIRELLSNEASSLNDGVL